MRINAFNIMKSISGTFDGKVFKILKDGRNIVFKHSWLAGLPSLSTDAMVVKYKSLSQVELQKWEKVKSDEGFWSRYQAFASSFFLYVVKYGLANAIVDTIPFMYSRGRIERQLRLWWLVTHRTGQVDEKTNVQDSLDTLSLYGKTLTYPFILPDLSSDVDISTASLLNLVQPKTGFGTGTFGAGTFGT